MRIRDRPFTGTVTSIRKAPINVQNVITYDAVIGVSNLDLKLFPGMTANVKILVNQRPNVLKVPNAALRYHPAAEPAAAGAGMDVARGAAPEKAVWILDASHMPQRVVVTTGETDGTFDRSDQRRPEGRGPRDCRSAGESRARVGRRPRFRERQGRQRPGF